MCQHLRLEEPSIWPFYLPIMTINKEGSSIRNEGVQATDVRDDTLLYAGALYRMRKRK